jgi:hypothetical protein
MVGTQKSRAKGSVALKMDNATTIYGCVQKPNKYDSSFNSENCKSIEMTALWKGLLNIGSF